MSARIPENEAERLAALDRRQVLDTLPESICDDDAAQAADICGTPIALVSLVDQDRQWFKVKVGIDFDETPRGAALCARAVLRACLKMGAARIWSAAALDPRRGEGAYPLSRSRGMTEEQRRRSRMRDRAAKDTFAPATP